MSNDLSGVQKGLVYLGVIAALTASASVLARDEKHITDSDARYEGAPSAIPSGDTKDMITSEGPTMSVEEFNHSKQIFFERCAGELPAKLPLLYARLTG